MSETAEAQDVNNELGEDRTTEDHQAGIGPSADELESHNLDIEDFDEAVKEIDGFDEEAEETPGVATTTDESGSEDEGSSEEEEGKETPADVPYDRFKEVNDLKNQQAVDIARLEGRLEAMQQAALAAPVQESVQEVVPLPLDDILGQEHQVVLDAFQENPADFLTKLQERSTAIALQHVAAQQEEEKSYQAMSQSLEAFATDHEDFMPNMDKIVGAMQSDPKQNAISAYYEMFTIPGLIATHETQVKDLETKLTTAKEEGIEEGRKKAIAEIRAKGGAATLDGSQSTQGGVVTPDPELTDTAKSGGLRKIITERLKRKREAS